jgi:vesicular inhibitory amino acid transporter
LKIALRTSAPLIALGLSIILPDFLELMELVGAVFGIFISLVIPVLCYRKIFQGQLSRVQDVGLLALIVLGSFLIISGVWSVLLKAYIRDRPSRSIHT